MGRKNVVKSYNSFDNVSLAANQTSPVTDIAFKDNIGIIVDWSGTAPLGELIVEATNDDNEVDASNWTWVALDFGNTITINGATGNHLINISQAPFNKIRLRYARTSGTGNLTATMTIKEIGG